MASLGPLQVPALVQSRSPWPKSLKMEKWPFHLKNYKTNQDCVMKHFFLKCWLEHKWLLILGGWGGRGAHRWVARGSNWAKSRLRSQLLKNWQKWKIMIFLQKTIALQLVSTKKLDADRNKGPEMAKFGTKIFCTCIGPTDTFSLAYNFWDICARTMEIVSFERKFVVDYKTCVNFYNPPSNQVIVVSQTTSKFILIWA